MSSTFDGPDAFDCEHAHAARTCGCGFCKALPPRAYPRKQLTLTVDIKASDLVGKIDGAGGLILDIMAEREHQDIQWGGAEHDDQHNGGDWLRCLDHQRNVAMDETLDDHCAEVVDPVHYRERLVKIAALAWAALEAHDRKGIKK